MYRTADLLMLENVRRQSQKMGRRLCLCKGRNPGVSSDGYRKYKISIKSLFLDKNEIMRENNRKDEKMRDKRIYVHVKPFANTRI